MKFHCMNSVELILLKCIPRGHPNPCYRVGLSCSIFKNTSATCAYPLVSNARKLKRDKRAHACAQGTFSYTPCSRRGLTKNIYVSIYFSLGTFSYTPCSRRGLTKNIYVSIYFLRKAPSRTPYPIVARALGLAECASKGILHTK